MHLPILTTVTSPPEGSCPLGSLVSAFVSRLEGCWYLPPPLVKGERGVARASVDSGPGLGSGEDGFNAVGPVTCEKEGEKNVSL